MFISDNIKSNVSCTTIVHTLYNKAYVKMIFTLIVHIFFFTLIKRKKESEIHFHVSFVQETLL
jgi:hypothetical protein